LKWKNVFSIISFKSEIENILKRLEIIGKKTGARDHYFKLYEGKLADGVCALYDFPDKKLRLYCIRFGTQLLILGGGGQKKVKKLQDDEKLKKESYLLRRLSEELTKRIKDRDIRFSNEGKDFEGDTDFLNLGTTSPKTYRFSYRNQKPACKFPPKQLC
jgi:hypothetical protein